MQLNRTESEDCTTERGKTKMHVYCFLLCILAWKSDCFVKLQRNLAGTIPRKAAWTRLL